MGGAAAAGEARKMNLIDRKKCSLYEFGGGFVPLTAYVTFLVLSP